MFTGIIENKGRITNLTRSGRSLQIHLETEFSDLTEGESVAVNGVCLTVTHPTPRGECDLFLSPETLDKSNLGQVTAGDFLNLERALTLQTRLSGHWVQGHVDGQAKWLGARPEFVNSVEPTSFGNSIEPTLFADSTQLDRQPIQPTPAECFAVGLLLPKALARYCVEKGSICLNGVSLTINSIIDNYIGSPAEGSPGILAENSEGSIIQITIIPHTWTHTNLSKLKPGDTVNVEVDILAKYVERLCRN